MIRSRRLNIKSLNKWLVKAKWKVESGGYRLRVWKEHRDALPKIKNEIIAYINEIFDDVRLRLRRGFEDELSHFKEDPSTDPAWNYPALLHTITLQGYFGETLGAIAVEHWGAHGHSDWIVPAFLFRFHNLEFQHLDSINDRLRSGQVVDPDAQAEQRIGRTGDDGLAFRMGADDQITHVIAIEAKCLAKSNSAQIRKLHEKLSGADSNLSGVRELISLLSEYETTKAEMWRKALVRLWQSRFRDATRYDGACYVCGNAPVKNSTWLPSDAPHESYKGARPLEAMEFHLSDLPDLIQILYRGGRDG